jgi:UDP-glucose 4-epimerase
MTSHYAGRRALVTGGTGSFGQTVVRRTLATDVAEVRVLSRDEAKHDQMRVDLADPRVRFHVGDIRDYLSVERACRGALPAGFANRPRGRGVDP